MNNLHSKKYLLAGMLLMLCAACSKDAATASRPEATAIVLSANDLTLMSGSFEVIRVTIEPTGTGITAEDLMLVNAQTGEASAYISMKFNGDDDNGSFSMGIRDNNTNSSYKETVKIVCPKAGGLSSGPLTVRSAPRMPIVYVTSEQPVTSKDIWVKGTIRIDGGNTFEDLEQMTTEVKGRGNSTWGWEKKPYALKLDSKKEVLGMPKHKRWCLIANHMDRTHMRNRLAYYIGQHSHLAWTVRNEYVEVYFNGEYLGLYLLTEQIKEDPNRVNITEMSGSDNQGDAVTGGYLLEVDAYFDEVKRFQSSATGLPVNIKYPDPEEITDTQFNYIQDYFNAADAAVKAAADSSTTNGLFDRLDIPSLIDYWLIYEVMANHEPLNPKSVYFYKERGEKLTAGPIWDFDYQTLIPERTNAWQLYGKTNTMDFSKGLNWWNIFFKDASFRAAVKVRWMEWYPFLKTVPQFIDQQKQSISSAEGRNRVRWPQINGTGNVNGDEMLSFPDAVARFRQVYAAHLEWMNGEITNW